MLRVLSILLSGVVVLAAGCGRSGSTAPLPPASATPAPVTSFRPPATLAAPASTEPAAAASGGGQVAANEAPVATLVTATGRHPGDVGGYDFTSFTQSAPWLPAAALDRVDVAAGESLRVELDGRASIAEWTAAYAAAADVSGDRLVGLGSGAAAVAFAAPPVGDWVVTVTVVYADGLGSGAYYWHVVAG